MIHGQQIPRMATTTRLAVIKRIAGLRMIPHVAETMTEIIKHQNGFFIQYNHLFAHGQKS